MSYGSENHPFTPGTSVVVQDGKSSYHGGTFRDDVVHKIHTNGNFTLKGDPKTQWRPSRDGYDDNASWRAWRTKDRGYCHTWSELRLSDDAAKAERERVRAVRAHQDRCKRIKEFFDPYDASKRIAPELSQAVMNLIAPPKVKPNDAEMCGCNGDAGE